jgi:hypothetical protein
MSDIEERLRAAALEMQFSWDRDLLDEAADEYARLRALLAEREARSDALESLALTLTCIDRNRFTEHDEALLESAIEAASKLCHGPLPTPPSPHKGG